MLQLKYHLRVGLSYEKTRDFDAAFISYGLETRQLRAFTTQGQSGSAQPPGRDTVREIYNLLSRHANKNDEEYISMLLLEYYRLAYQPLLARLVILEKNGIQGVTLDDVDRTIAEFKHLLSYIQQKEKFFIEAEFYSKLGNILFYKNGNLPSKEKKPTEPASHRDIRYPVSAIGLYLKSLLVFLRQFEVHSDTKVDDLAYRNYIEQIEEKTLDLSQESERAKLLVFLKNSLVLLVEVYDNYPESFNSNVT
jgi:hypothetical protein